MDEYTENACGTCGAKLNTTGEHWRSGNVVCFSCLEPFEEDLRRELYGGQLEPGAPA